MLKPNLVESEDQLGNKIKKKNDWYKIDAV